MKNVSECSLHPLIAFRTEIGLYLHVCAPERRQLGNNVINGFLFVSWQRRESLIVLEITNDAFLQKRKMTSGLIPARFLTVTAHFILTMAIFWSRDENVQAGLPVRFSQRQYENKDIEFIVALSLSLACFAIEMFGFFGGISTFLPSIGLTSTSLHSAACVALAFFIWDVWDCQLYWYIFGFCSAFPAILEIAAIVGVLGLKKPI